MLNVLVYSGTEVLQSSLSSVITSLRALLLPHYVVQPIEHTALTKQPWTTSCALLVFPRLDQPFTAPAHTHIQDYVDRGGAFLALGSGARFSPRGVTDTLRFFDKFNNVYIQPTFGSGSSNQRLVRLESLDGDIIRAVYESSPCEFTGFKGGEKGIKILGRYLQEGPGDNDIAGLGSDIGGGRVALWSPALEQCLSSGPASSLISATHTQEEDIAERDKERRNLLRRTLIYLGLHLPASSASSDRDDDLHSRPIARPFPQFLVSSPDRPDVVARIVDQLSGAFKEDVDDAKVIKDANDTLQFHESTSTSTKSLLKQSKSLLTTPSDPSTWQPKHIIIHRDGTLPPTTYTSPYFDISLFFQHLSSLRSPASSISSAASQQQLWPLGSALFFSPSITSTQTLLDKNPLYLSSLPTPTVHIASHQLLARGRGSNAWLSPSGSLSQSIHLRLRKDQGVPWSKLVFVQYLYALAVCEGVRDESVLGDEEGGEGWRVRIKWPNDVYAYVSPKGTNESEMEKQKIGGILVSTSFSSEGHADIIIGCGLNVFNEHPMTSLVHLLKSSSPRRKNLSIERIAAVILVKFEQMWTQFVDAKGNFEPFLDRYLTRWMHSDQLVTLTTITPPVPVRITGITLDHGLLRTVPERPRYSFNPYFSQTGGAEEYIDLQPDGNSFDLMAGLIKTKH